MPRFGPIKRRELIACLRRLGDIGPNLLSQVLRQASVAKDEWEAL